VAVADLAVQRAAACSWSQKIERAWLARGPVARLLWPLSWLYRGLWATRCALYRHGLLRVQTLPVPVVVVGNLVAGGAGKTPTTLAVLALLRQHGYVPGVVSRGYGRQDHGVILLNAQTTVQQAGDEPLLIYRRAGVPVAVGRDRVAAARALLGAQPQINILVSDDGLQHRRLGRDLQIIVFDERGTGNGWLLPAGPLREPLQGSAAPARSLVLYNAPAQTTPWPGALVQRRLGGVVRLAQWWQGQAAQTGSLQTLAQQQGIVAVAGLARPQRFFHMLRAAGLRITALGLPDHDPYTRLPWPSDAPCVIVTEKDAIKLDPSREGTAQVWVAALDFSFPPDFAQALLQALPESPHHGHPTA
jgi:tetraacyldisaccharide 4'-kinase